MTEMKRRETNARGKKTLILFQPAVSRTVPSLWFLFPPSTAPPYIRCRVPVPTVSFSVVCPVVPEPSRRSHTVSPTSVLLGKLFSISFLSGFLGFPSYYDHGFATNWSIQLQLWRQQSRWGGLFAHSGWLRGVLYASRLIYHRAFPGHSISGTGRINPGVSQRQHPSRPKINLF